MEWCEIPVFQFLKIRKLYFRWNIKIKYVTDVSFSVISSNTKDYTYLSLGGEHLKVKRLHKFQLKK